METLNPKVVFVDEKNRVTEVKEHKALQTPARLDSCALFAALRRRNVKMRARMAFLTNRDHEDRPWGAFDRFTRGEPSTVKVIAIKPGQRFSLQYHNKRSEFWHILAGTGVVSIDGEEHVAKAHDEFEIPVGAKHRAAAGEQGLRILEIALGDFDENDIVRLEDDYGRTTD